QIVPSTPTPTFTTESTASASEKFHASESWFYGFLRRYNFAMRRKTKIDQKLPPHINIKILEFQQFIIKKQKQFEYEISEIGNMDKTPVYFDMVWKFNNR
ncbi:6200_t:CDS:2, partial [Entrophospora sp. SA101]